MGGFKFPISGHFFKVSFLPFLFILLASMVIMVFSEEDAIKPEKIFRHDRVEPQKLARVDLDNEELKRALEDLRRRVPEYTGYLLVDVVVEIFKMIFVSFLRLLGQHQRRMAIGTD